MSRSGQDAIRFLESTDEVERALMQGIAAADRELRKQELDYLAVRIIEKFSESLK